jgi:hypothetical protein
MMIGEVNMKLIDKKTSLYIYCDGGFGNRFNSLVSGLLISKFTKIHPIIVWPATNWCRSKFSTLFDTEFEVIEHNLNYFGINTHEYEFIMHGNFLNFNTQVHHPQNFRSINDICAFCLNSSKNKIVYNNDAIPHYINQELIVQVIHELSFNKNIISEANNYIQNNLGQEYTGVHLRNTDFFDPHKPNFDQIYQHILENIDKRYFVCSDDKEMEDMFNQLENVSVYPKTSYVEKLTEDGEWRSVIVDDTGIEYPFNIERSDESVQQAIIDLYILSKSNIMKTSDSSFLKTAILLKNSYQNG